MTEIKLELQAWRGYSAYEIAVQNGFIGSPSEWQESLKGRDGGVTTVNGIAHDANGNVSVIAGSIPVSEEDGRTMQEVTVDVDKLTGAISVTDGALGKEAMCRDTACWFYVANEGISLIENLNLMGVPFPAKIKEILGEKASEPQYEPPDTKM